MFHVKTPLGLTFFTDWDTLQPAIDVEASLHGDGLDIGVFGPSNLLAGDDAASGLVAEIVTALCEG